MCYACKDDACSVLWCCVDHLSRISNDNIAENLHFVSVPDNIEVVFAAVTQTSKYIAMFSLS